MRIDDHQLEAFLIDTGLASKGTLDAAKKEAEESKSKLGHILEKQGILTEKDLRRANSFILGIPYVNLEDTEIPYSVLSLIPEPLSRKYKVVAFKKENGILHTAFIEPTTLGEIKFLEGELDVKIKSHLTDEASIKHALRLYHEGLRKEFGDVIENESRSLKNSVINSEASDEDLRKFATDDRITRILDALISHALLSRASYIHIEPRAGELAVRYRVKGVMHDAIILPKHISPHLILRTKHLSNMDLRDTSPQEGKIKYEDGKTKVSLRVSTLPVGEGEKIVIRRVTEHASGFTLESLGLRGRNLDNVHEMLEKKEGLILVSSPKASGKTTFLYTALDLLSREHLSIQTVEEKIEYPLPGISQSEVNTEKGVTYERLLRSVKRTDPDVLMASTLGESSCAELLSTLALTGRLVLTGMDARSGGEAIATFAEQSGGDLASSALSGSINIRLVKKIGSTKEKYFLNKEEVTSLGALVKLDKLLGLLKEEGLVEAGGTWQEVPFYKEIHPSHSSESAYIGLFETVVLNANLRELVMNSAPATSIEAEAARSGTISLIEDGILKASLGLTTLEEVLRAVS